MHLQRKVLKVCLVGDSFVGKTSLVLRHVKNRFTETFITTIGVDFLVKPYIHENYEKKEEWKIQFWDTAGQERFETITRSYYRTANIMCIVYDVNKSESYYNIVKWLKNVKDTIVDMDNVLVVLIGNKTDLLEGRATNCLTPDLLNSIKSDNKDVHILNYVCSAKTGENVNSIFNKVVYIYLKYYGDKMGNITNSINLEDTELEKPCCNFN